jgi:hypothetical protein
MMLSVQIVGGGVGLVYQSTLPNWCADDGPRSVR